MKWGVLSDTHLASLDQGLTFLEALCRGPFAAVDQILHAGDIVHPDLLHCFDLKPVVAVRGNCDDASVCLPARRIHRAGDLSVGLTHGWGPPSGVVRNVLSTFADAVIDALVFGHSHLPYCRRSRGGMLLFNPGSATDRRQAPFHSVGILTFGETVEGEIVNIDALLDEVMPQRELL